MEKLLLETFEGLSLTDRQKKVFSKVFVKRVLISKQAGRVTVYLESDHIIPFREIGLLEYALGQEFARMKFSAAVREHFTLPGSYTPEAFWREYSESILLLLKEKNVLLFNMLYRGEVSIEGNLMRIACEDDMLFRAREQELKEYIQEIFRSKADFAIEMAVSFSLESQSREPEGYEVFRRNEQGYYTSSRVKNLYEKASMSPEEYAALPGNQDLSPSSRTDSIPGAGCAEGAGQGDGHVFSRMGYEQQASGGGGDRMGDSFVPSGEANGAMMGFDVPSGEANGAMMGFDVPLGGNVPEMTAPAPKPGQVAKARGDSARKKEKEASSGKNYGDKSRSQGKKGFYKKSGGKWGKGPADPDCFYGRNCEGEVIKIADIQGEVPEAVIEGMVLSVEEREIRNEKVIYMFNLSDFTDSIMAKIFLEKEELELMRENVKKGSFIKIKGNPMYDTYSREITMGSIKGMKPGVDTRVKRMDAYEGKKRVELHAHTQMSEMDSVVPVRDFVKTAKGWGHPALAITDHGVVQAFPDADHEVSPEEDFKMLYGVEAYLVDDLIETVKNGKGQDFHDTFVVFDLETTGIGPKSNEIIEIGAVKVVDGVMGDTFSEFVNPERPIPYHIQELTGIDDSMVAGAENIDAILPRFLSFCQGAVMVAHNASFDMGFIEQKARERGMETDFTVIDTVSVARALLPDLKRYKLDTVAKKLGVSLENHHRAVDDATATAEIFVKMMERLVEQGKENLEQLNAFGKPNGEAVKKMPSYHAVILAKNETGRINLYRLVSESHLHYFSRRPRLPKSLFLKWREGLVIWSAREGGGGFLGLFGGGAGGGG